MNHETMVPDKELLIHKILQQLPNKPVLNRMGTLKPYFIFQKNHEWSKHMERCSSLTVIRKTKTKIPHYSATRVERQSARPRGRASRC